MNIILSGFAIIGSMIVCCNALPQLSRSGNNQIGGNNFNRNVGAQQLPTSTSTVSPITITSEFSQCTSSCQVLATYNPLCGSDRRNYQNDQRLACHNFCGRRLDRNWQDITALRAGLCTPGGRVELTSR